MTDKENDHNVVSLKDFKDRIAKKLSDESYGNETYEDYDNDGSNILMIDLSEAEALVQLNIVFPEGIPEELNCSRFFLMGILADEDTPAPYEGEEVEFDEIEDLLEQCDSLHVALEEKDSVIEGLLQEIKQLNRAQRKLEKTIKTLTAPEGKLNEPK